jgi:D-alanyl-D-alanine carboxypeptidase/D-alanyl-D-alanine-endopeptidase (penicillin-binding protein 4)
VNQAASPGRARARRGTTTRRVVVAVLLLVAVVAIVLATRAPGSSGSATARPALATPLWSARRVPQTLVDGVGQQRLQAALDAQGTGDTCFAVEDATGTVASTAADRPLIPASTQKVLVALAALDRLGPDFRYETRAVAPGGVDGGTIERLFLVGAGDPVIATPEAVDAIARSPLTRGDATTPLADLADALVEAGVRRIPGGIVGDDSRYDDARSVPEWPASYQADREVGPIGALTVNDGFGGPDGSGPAADDPSVQAAEQLARLLEARGVTVGPAAAGRAPEGAEVVATLTSPPLAEILTAFLASSDNLTGELLARELAAHAGGPATTERGTQAMLETFTRLGLPTAGTVLVDGSGLARQNRATCALLLAALDLADQPRFATLRDGMAVAGERGTLATRLRGTPLAGTLRAKTGSLSGVTGLTGFVTVGRPLEFALLVNGSFSESGGIGLRERMAATIAGYPDSPPAEDLVPMPLTPTAAGDDACPSSPAAC